MLVAVDVAGGAARRGRVRVVGSAEGAGGDAPSGSGPVAQADALTE